MGLLKTGVDYFLVYRFIRALTTPFNKTKAFELGIIDAEGNFLKKFKQLKTREEKESFGAYERMVWNLKKLIEKVPVIGKALTSWAGMAYLLLKENSSEGVFDTIKRTCFLRHVWEDLDVLVEAGVPTVNTSGNFAGLPPDEPPVSKKNQKKHVKKNSTSGKSGRKKRAKLKSRG